MGYYILSLIIPNQYYERYRTYIDRYRTCRHISSTSYADIAYIKIAFRPITEDSFVEKILQNIDELCYGDIEVIDFSKSKPDAFAF